MTTKNDCSNGFVAHILLVDDEEFLVKLWKQVIELRGYKVTCYTDGLLALEAFKGNPDSFALVITDQCMPNITGYQLATELFRIREDIKIIMCSGYFGEVDRDDSLDKKISEFLIKPFDIKSLIKAIEKNLI